MENQNDKPRMDLQGVMKAADKQLPLKQRPRELAARFLALSLTLDATVVVGINKEMKTITGQIADGLPYLPVTAKWQYMSAFIYFVACNAIACTYAAASLAHSTTRALGKNMALATHPLGTLPCMGNSHVHWDMVCDVFNDYSWQMAAVLVLSLLGSFAFLWLAAVNFVNLQKRT
ncbi:hypothetical protein MLD38_025098 [Melastoma candidum]|uniref:Uncharacterized protein n=1 Tax=Melastoma candidum TaxID=119954 RepID=A0ACB9NXT4_9MYRT|nr:hypothetical protein MLD38_025098 [Melastoma candidum]